MNFSRLLCRRSMQPKRVKQMLIAAIDHPLHQVLLMKHPQAWMMLIIFFSGRVGFRCVHCAHTERRRKMNNARKTTGKEQYDPHCTRMSSFYPESVSDLYRLVCLWQSCHFRKCRNIPPAVRDTYQNIKQGRKTLGKTRYWVSSAEKLGLVDIPKTKEGRAGGGICFALNRSSNVCPKSEVVQ
mmetsp:Transcript_24742/g.36862  ORF Transcript_24742/g.36862 Transcript_24742/m.36862 type:complete len:183 (+) Transcript_24742:1041-1589(+)